jgi:prepilin-type N-terminal cleavage/methylation domain-containing protein
MSFEIVPKNDRGVTLMEIMITIIIAGMVVVLSVPSFNRFLQSWKLNGEAEQFAVVLRTARSAAVVKNTNAVFSFDEHRRTYFYFEDLDKDGVCDNSEYRSATYRFVPQVTFAARTLPGTTVTFGPMGNTRFSGSVTLRNNRERIKTVRIYGGTGNITID